MKVLNKITDGEKTSLATLSTLDSDALDYFLREIF